MGHPVGFEPISPVIHSPKNQGNPESSTEASPCPVTSCRRHHPADLYPFEIGKSVYLFAMESEDTVLVNDLVLFFVEDPALVIGSAKEGKETDDQRNRVLPNKYTGPFFLPGDDQGKEDQQPDEEKQNLVAKRYREDQPPIGKLLQLQTKSYHQPVLNPPFLFGFRDDTRETDTPV